MMIFLCGGGSGEQTIEATRRFSDVIDHTKPLLYVPLAMEPDLYPSCLEWIKDEMCRVNVTDIEMVTSAIIFGESLESCALDDVNGDKIKVIGTRPYYYFENGIRRQCKMIRGCIGPF